MWEKELSDILEEEKRLLLKILEIEKEKKRKPNKQKPWKCSWEKHRRRKNIQRTWQIWVC